MDKQTALKRAKEKGYDAGIVNSVLMFYKTGEKPTYEEIKDFVKEIGYDQSFGLAGGKGKQLIGESEKELDES